jgi:hypothetical protein
MADACPGIHFCDNEYLPLVGGDFWLPPEPYEHAWSFNVGCNNMVCSQCRRPVRSEIPGGQDAPRWRLRRYECGCQHIAIETHKYVGEPFQSHYGPEVDHWRCDGHPDLTLPAMVDGVALSMDADWVAITRQALLDPPFRVPGDSGLQGAWVARLRRLLQSEEDRQRLALAVQAQLESDDPWLVRHTLDLYMNHEFPPDLDHLREWVDRRVVWLRATPDPRDAPRRLVTFARRTITWGTQVARVGRKRSSKR